MPINRRQFLAHAMLGGALAPAARAADDDLVVFAAVSLTEVLRTITAAHWHGPRLRFSFAASSTLARQIEQGAPAHVFVSADEAWMDYLVERRHVEPASRRVLAGNRLVVVRRAATPPASVDESLQALRSALRGGVGSGAPDRVATGDPAHVPVGRYAQAALTRLGLWADVAPRLVRADNVRSALIFVERGEAAAGIVYATDAPIAHGVQVVARFPRDSHPPIRYLGARVNGAPPAAGALLDLLGGAGAQPLWRAAGFDAAA
ncbi:molybdate ABC transporter substrate-binding protein [Piscinibacter sp.]|uniref:molybdate ABC transporter substrate-binding protein n=1 Tax=Piscinibacter sp. TaxID=1903157 RepID=UPI002F42A16C